MAGVETKSIVSNRPSIIFLLGPTACGKTDLILNFCENFPAEVISVDSTKVYRHLNIGSAKPSSAMLNRIPHWLINIAEPTEIYSAARFVDDSLRAIETIVAEGKIPVLVGGSMMYFNSLLNGLSKLPAADASIRTELELKIKKSGIQSLYAQLQLIDPLSARRLHPNQKQRIIRALEVYKSTGKPISSWWRDRKTNALEEKYSIYQFGMMPSERSLLHAKIEKRFLSMIACGFAEEVRELHRRGDLNCQLPAVRSVGYRQLWSFVEGEIKFEEALNRGIVATRQLAKRQLTWMRGWRELNLLPIDDGKKLFSTKKIADVWLKMLSRTPMSNNLGC